VVIEKPVWDYAAGTDSERNDFGLGFYTSTDADQPLMLLCERSHVVLNRYALTLDGLDVKRIPNDAEWLMTVVFNRRDFISKKRLHAIRDAYRGKFAGIDAVIGAIANDRLFSTINAFIENNITDAVAVACLEMMRYAPQIVLKSTRACGKIAFLDAEVFEGDRLAPYRERVVAERALVDDRITEIKEQKFREGRLLSELLKEIAL
jgi:hypothetical protein